MVFKGKLFLLFGLAIIDELKCFRKNDFLYRQNGTIGGARQHRKPFFRSQSKNAN